MKSENIIKDIQAIKDNISNKYRQLDRLNFRLNNLKTKFILNKKLKCIHCINESLLKDSIIICKETMGSFNYDTDSYDYKYYYFYICAVCNHSLYSLDFEKELESIGISVPYNKILQNLEIKYSTWSYPSCRMPEVLRKALDT